MLRSGPSAAVAFVSLILSFPLASASEGPARLVVDWNREAMDVGTPPRDFVALGGKVYFAAAARNSGLELWATDGTAAGTALVRDICPGRCGSKLRQLTVVNDTAFFTAFDGCAPA